jgi:branched-chain amino acid transport system ATP-binding protein
MLELVNVEFMFSRVILVLKGISLKVPKGDIITLLGANGAGKTTTIGAISGLLHTEEGEVTDGHILFEGKPIEHMDPTDIVRKGVVPVLDGRRVIEHMTVEQNLLVGSHMRPDIKEVREDIEKVYSYFPILERLKNRTTGYLSGGEQQMLVTSRGLMAKPRLMLLDEPSMGLAPLVVKEIFHVLARFNRDESITMLLVEQNVRIALSIASYGYLLENGRIVLDGPARDLAANEDIKEFYLGLSLSGGRKSYREVKHYKRRKRWLG